MHKKLRTDQSGIVSFMIMIIVMMVLTLIVLSFARLVRREQRQTLDRQLNSQAFYAAESGVNDAIDALRDNPALMEQDYNNECNEFIADAGLGTERELVGPEGFVSYSCLLVDSSPGELNFTSIPTNESAAVPIRPAEDIPITTLQISWSGDAGNSLTDCPASAVYPGAWDADCDVGMLRVELVPFEAPPLHPNRISLIKNRAIAYVQPSAPPSGDSDFTFAEASDAGALYRQGVRHVATCNVPGTPRQCTVNITGLNLRNGYLRLRSMYRNAAVTVRAFDGAPTDDNRLDLIGAQVEIDVTGRANDVLKRIKVNRALTFDGPRAPDFAVQTAKTQCKRFEIAPGLGSFPPIMNVIWYDGSSPTSACNPRQTTN